MTPHPDWKIREARPGDEKGIHVSHMRSINEVCVRDHGLDETRGWGNRPLTNRWTQLPEGAAVWVVERDAQIYGHAAIRIYKEAGVALAHIHGLYLTPEIIGLGVGKKLAQLMLDQAKNAEVEKITLESTLTAHDFYLRLGFTDRGPLQSTLIGGYPVRYYPMEKILNS